MGSVALFRAVWYVLYFWVADAEVLLCAKGGDIAHPPRTANCDVSALGAKFSGSCRFYGMQRCRLQQTTTRDALGMLRGTGWQLLTFHPRGRPVFFRAI